MKNSYLVLTLIYKSIGLDPNKLIPRYKKAPYLSLMQSLLLLPIQEDIFECLLFPKILLFHIKHISIYFDLSGT